MSNNVDGVIGRKGAWEREGMREMKSKRDREGKKIITDAPAGYTFFRKLYKHNNKTLDNHYDSHNLYSVQCTLYSSHCLMYTVQCSVI